MLTGKPPYYSEQIPILYSYIKNAPLHFPCYVSCEAKDLIQVKLYCYQTINCVETFSERSKSKVRSSG